MGSLVEYHCAACSFSSGQLQIGWGKAGRSSFWGGLARCEPCEVLGVADLALRGRGQQEPRCGACRGPLTLLEGTSVTVACPRCRAPLHQATVGVWA